MFGHLPLYASIQAFFTSLLGRVTTNLRNIFSPGRSRRSTVGSSGPQFEHTSPYRSINPSHQSRRHLVQIQIVIACAEAATGTVWVYIPFDKFTTAILPHSLMNNGSEKRSNCSAKASSAVNGYSSKRFGGKHLRKLST